LKRSGCFTLLLGIIFMALFWPEPFIAALVTFPYVPEPINYRIFSFYQKNFF